MKYKINDVVEHNNKLYLIFGKGLYHFNGDVMLKEIPEPDLHEVTILNGNDLKYVTTYNEYRLDKVLSKLTQYASGLSLNVLSLGYENLEIQYNKETNIFVLAHVAHNGGWKSRITLSLDTVESIIKDMGDKI